MGGEEDSFLWVYKKHIPVYGVPLEHFRFWRLQTNNVQKGSFWNYVIFASSNMKITWIPGDCNDSRIASFSIPREASKLDFSAIQKWIITQGPSPNNFSVHCHPLSHLSTFQVAWENHLRAEEARIRDLLSYRLIRNVVKNKLSEWMKVSFCFVINGLSLGGKLI